MLGKKNDVVKSRLGHRMALLGSFVVAGMLAAGSVAAEKVRYTDHDPLGGMRTQFANDVWLKEIAEKSNGALEPQAFFGGTLMGSKEVLTGLGDGVADLGFVFPGHYPERLVAHTIFPLFPRGPAKYENMAWLYNQIYDRVPAFRAELEAAGVVPLLATAGLPGAFSATYELNGLDDLKGKKWRAGGKWPLKYLEMVGASPVSVPWGDVYIALQTGTINGVFTNYDGLNLMRFDEVGPNLLISKELWYAVPFLHLANKKFYDGLSDEGREALKQASAEAEKQFAAVYEDTYTQIRQSEIDAGAKVTELSEADITKWENAEQLKGLQDTWIEEAKASGLENAAEVMEQVRGIVAEAMMRP